MNRMKLSLMLLMFICVIGSSHAQIIIQHNGSLRELMVKLQNEYGYQFMYSNNEIDDRQKVTIQVKKSNLETLLKQIFEDLNISYRINKRQIILRYIGQNKNDGYPSSPDYVSNDSSVILSISHPDIQPSETDTMQLETEPELVYLQPVSSQLPISPPTNSILPAPVSSPDNETYNSFKDNTSPKLRKHSVSINNNLLYDMILTPNLGIEYSSSKNFSIIINASWAHIDWDRGNKTYRQWLISPELRFYVGNRNRFYVGGMFQTGELNLKIDETGHQGGLLGGSFVSGYVMNISNRIKFDFGAGLGYVRFRYDAYHFREGINVKNESGIKNLLYPTKIGVTLVWKII